MDKNAKRIADGEEERPLKRIQRTHSTPEKPTDDYALRAADDGSTAEDQAAQERAPAAMATGGDVTTAPMPANHDPFPPGYKRNPHIFPLLLLPSELRIKIYRLLYKVSHPVFPPVTSIPASRLRPSGFTPGTVLALVSANKQLSREVTDVIYKENTFRLSLRYHRVWISHIGRRNSDLLQRVILVGDSRQQHAAEQLSAMVVTFWKRAFTNLRHITVHGEWTNLDSGFVPRQLLAIGARRKWRRFTKLQGIQIDVPHSLEQLGDRSLYEDLCVQTSVRVTGRHSVNAWNLPLVEVGDMYLIAGELWIDLDPNESEMQRRIEEQRGLARQAT